MQIPDRFETEHFRFVNYTQVTESDHRQILEARNHPDVACWMENTDTISWSSHQNYVHSLAQRADRVYFGVYENGGGKIIGSQSLNPILNDIEGESGLYLFPQYQGRGWGKLMKQEFIAYIFNNDLLQQITEKVKHTNVRNQQLNLSLGFEHTGEDEKYVYYWLTKDKFKGI